MNKIQKEDIQRFVDLYTNSFGEQLKGSSFLITGATGLIGSIFVKCLLAFNKNIKITCPVRNKRKAIEIFGDNTLNLNLIETDIIEYTKNLCGDFIYIIHCASPTDGGYMIEHPVETFELAVDTMQNLLRYAIGRKNCSILYVSSLESYGQILDESLITEDRQGYIDMSSPRSCYPLGKQAAEYLCVAHSIEYKVNVKIARLTQTFGAGILSNDNRVFAQFARNIINNNDIVLHTNGMSAKPYIYTTDCISAMLYILLKGNSGEAYNVANEDTYISIKDMALFLRDNFSPNINVIKEDYQGKGYAPITKLRLSTQKLKTLGWKPQYELKEMYERLINSLKE